MLILYGLLAFLVGAAFFVVCPAIWLYGESREYLEPRTIICPETLRWADVRVDAVHAARSALAGHAQFRLLACSRWPERQSCGQACAAQVPLVGDDRRLTPYAPFALDPRFLRINHPVRMTSGFYARLSESART